MSVHNWKTEAESYNDSVVSGTDVDIAGLDVTVKTLTANDVTVGSAANTIMLNSNDGTYIDAATANTIGFEVSGGTRIATVDGNGLTVNVGNLITAGTGIEVAAGDSIYMAATAFLKLGCSTLAAAGSQQSDAASIVNQVTRVTGGNDTTGVKLPSIVDGEHDGRVYFIFNAGTAGLKVYPNTGEDINNGADNTEVQILENTLAIFLALDDDDTWAAIYTANS